MEHYKFIIRCNCGGAKTAAEAGFTQLYPDQPMPETIHKDKAREYLNKIPNTDAAARLDAIVKRSGRYAYYIEFDDNGTLYECADLMNGKRGI